MCVCVSVCVTKQREREREREREEAASEESGLSRKCRKSPNFNLPQVIKETILKRQKLLG